VDPGTHRPAIALLSPPWPLYTRPSIQLGALKAFVRSRFPQVAVSAHHLYLKVADSIGYPLYHAVSERTWLAETVYGALLYPDRAAGIERLFRKEAAGSRQLRRTDFSSLVSQVQSATDEWIASTDWGAFRMVGVSSVLCQLTAALYVIRRLKQLHPPLTVVVGGTAFSHESAPAALALFPQIDAVVCGEGELPLAHLVSYHVLEKRALAEVPPAAGLLTRSMNRPLAAERAFYQMENLDHLPVPDFDDYFDMLSGFSPDKRFFATLPVEFSRGCWWQRDRAGGVSGGCAFCNLNLQWRGYRAKSPARAVSEVDALTRRHRLLSVALMDNVLPQKAADGTLQGLAELRSDLHVFAEIRASTSLKDLSLMREAGMRRVQVGIEALSTRLLRKLNKGTRAIQNLEIMKHCEAMGIANLSNLIAHFPLSDEADVEETLQVMAYARAYRPPRFVGFWLGLGSPVWRRPEAYGIRRVVNHPNWARIFPDAVFRNLPMVVQAFHGGIGRQVRLWKPVRSALSAWSRTYEQLHRGQPVEPILGYRDGGDFLIIRERRPGGETAAHRLEGSSRRIYLYCGHHRRLRRIIERFASIPPERIVSFLRKMTENRLMFAEDDRFLSLAVPACGSPPRQGPPPSGCKTT
jgi:ribosomal peptide maturation radical SAM protein 1